MASGKRRRKRVLAVAKQVTSAARQDDQYADALARAIEARRLLATLTDTGAAPEQASPPWPKRRAMLFVNAKSGPKAESLLHLRDLVDRLGQFNVRADVRVKLHKSQARREARAAARDGYDVVIAAGGDGTVEAVARGLAGTRATLGIIPLGTYNNIAQSLGIPSDPAAACALIAVGRAQSIDVGLVEARGLKKPRIFLETATIGLGAAAAPVGQHLEKGRWEEAAAALPVVRRMEPTTVRLRLDGDSARRAVQTLFITLSNAPRAGAALPLAPEAKLDDGLLDLAVYEGWSAAQVAQRALALKISSDPGDEPPEVRRARTREVEIWAARPLPVAADSRVIGVTPARIWVLPGALNAIVGRGPGVTNPPSQQLLALCHTLTEADAFALSPPPAAASSSQQTPLQAIVPAVGHTLDALEHARPAAAPIVAALAGIAAKALADAFVRRRNGR